VQLFVGYHGNKEREKQIKFAIMLLTILSALLQTVKITLHNRLFIYVHINTNYNVMCT